MMKGDFIVCRCEEVTMEKLAETIASYGCSSREAKLRTRAGMGICGGRTCRPFIERLVAWSGGREGDFPLPLKVQQPVRPLTFGNWGETS